jgi:AcrR family transcriptional regulator
MAANPPAKKGPLQPADWVRAALARLSEHGIGSVRVEILARDLFASKGSFYWHFRDCEDLLTRMLVQWEEDETHWLDEAASEGNAASRWAKFVERNAAVDRIRLDIALRAWARQDERVAKRLTAIEKRKAQFIAALLRETGFSPSAAESWSEAVLLGCFGWHDRSTRDSEFRLAGRSLGEFLSELVLAASARASRPSR